MPLIAINCRMLKFANLKFSNKNLDMINYTRWHLLHTCIL